VLVSARRFSQLELVDAELESPSPVEETPRALSAPELVAEIAVGDTGTRPGGTAEPGRVELTRVPPSRAAG
jgi:DNA recombination protein RmuC